MAMRARTSEKTLLIIYIAVFVVLTGAFAGLSYKTWKEIEEIRAQTAQLRVEIRKLQKKIDQLPDLEAERDALAAVMAEYEKILPDAEEIENLMTMLSEQAMLSDCKISNFTLGPGGAPTGRRGAGATAYKKVNFDCTISSAKRQKGFYCACKFLNLLERYERFIAADDFTLSGGRGAEASMHLDLTAHTYTFTGRKPAGAAK